MTNTKSPKHWLGATERYEEGEKCVYVDTDLPVFPGDGYNEAELGALVDYVVAEYAQEPDVRIILRTVSGEKVTIEGNAPPYEIVMTAVGKCRMLHKPKR